MYLGLIYNRLYILASGWLIITACLIRVSTNYLYGMHYQDADPRFWESVYYHGLSYFELFVLIGAAGLAKLNLPDRYFLAVSYFTDLAVYAWIKEYFLNPMKWNDFEEAGFLFSLALLLIRLAVSKQRRVSIIKYFKLIFR